MDILIGCEFSGIVREIFTQYTNHDVVSIDLLPSEKPGKHIISDILDVIYTQYFDMMIVFPPCTHLAVSGARWFKEKKEKCLQQNSLFFIWELLHAPIEKICLENPVSVISTYIRKPDQIIQPYQFGHGETKKTCLWLKNLPLLQPTNIVEGRNQRIWLESPSKDRWKNRSRTYTGIAKAMVEQWS